MPWVPIGIGRAPRGLPELNENVARVRFRARALILPTSPRPHPAGLFLAMGISDGTSSLWACGTPRVWATLAVELPWEAPLCLTHLLLVRPLPRDKRSPLLRLFPAADALAGEAVR
jgi:hypothetical protein